MYKKIHVYDVDGVLLDSAHRHRYNTDGSLDFAHYFANCIPEILAKDIILPMVEQYRADCIDKETYTVICTVRGPNMQEETLKRIGYPNLSLFVGETSPPCRPGHLLKLAALSKLFNLRQFAKLPRFFWEDSQTNIDATRHLFTRCFLLTDHTVRQF